MAQEAAAAEAAPKRREEKKKAEGEEGGEKDEGDGDGEKGEDADEGPTTTSAAGAEPKALRNQFNFSERAAQTFNHILRERSTETEPPPSIDFGSTVTQWEMYDCYMNDIENQKQQKERSKEKSKTKDKHEDGEERKEEKSEKERDVIHSAKMAKSLKIMERMVNQNTYDDITQDFRYWEDASDQYRDGEGTLLPLWRFTTDKAKRKQVTSLCWNYEYPDMFAVGYGSYDFLRQGAGLVCAFSLKNPSHPEYTFTTESGVMCIDFHPQHSSLLAVGLYDGTVMVFDVRNKGNRPIFQSTVKTGKHSDPVWEVRWQEEDMSKQLSFFSISSDGRVTLWTMSKNELNFTDVMELKLVSASGAGLEADEDSALSGLASGCCFDFNRTSDHLFLVGTEEGRIHKCSKAYNSQYLQTYEGHHMNVYAVRWNYYHPRAFLSASADWTVKLWDHNLKKPLMSFDLNNPVGDVSWAPFSSTVFAAVTADGKVHVFDLNENKHEALCEQKVVKKAKLTHVVFNPKHPVILIGDDRGAVTSLKLSPNLRKETTSPDAEADTDKKKKKRRGRKEQAEEGDENHPKPKTRKELEIEKLEKILAQASAGTAEPAAPAAPAPAS
eukprot:TRINITY_DN11489_c0_g1::TRINITY_DN11489_c0_g1_i1::g.10810::m.10810 TRINITY_DN11489_c0_g1::TRINITY_DN11489_c0_g1_i1::g.10810  ORF type:complete len:676 (-),score=212.66,sp/Q16959/DYI2_HELCR/53.04/0.0,WD40/PF00400.27/2.9e+02,WD40/PF00400.27/0.0002,WD40/PF00400.27/18,WD40/PF00400.27/3.8e-06,WD40/PF00400.27/0.073,WD40/PF00400.27/8.6e+02,TT_ORF2/PF02957.10/0.25,TT_ORF2/PF02957.10/4.8e+02,TT_ORF2/PF02957.10/2.8e+02 TRINITY_DN11489_c0_g1_i1:228-2057(-)